MEEAKRRRGFPRAAMMTHARIPGDAQERQQERQERHGDNRKMTPGKTQAKSQSRKRDSASYARRLKAAGAGVALSHDDIDARRYALARRIAMGINDWHGCPEPVCRRARGCMAPRNRCSNLKPLPPSSPEETARAVAQFMRRADAVWARLVAEGRVAQEEGDEEE
jgi:hypothetical protein